MQGFGLRNDKGNSKSTRSVRNICSVKSMFSASCDVTIERVLRRSCLDKGVEDTYNTEGLSWLRTDCLSLVKYFVSLFVFKESGSQICEVTEGVNARRTILANTHKRYNKENTVGSRWLCMQGTPGFVEKKTFTTLTTF